MTERRVIVIDGVEVILKRGIPPTQGAEFIQPWPGINPRVEKVHGMIIERDVAVEMRDGVKIRVDVYRPEKPGEYPVIINWSLYGKHAKGIYATRSGTGVDEDDLSDYTTFEGEDALYWVAQHSYVLIKADPRGIYSSEGDYTFATSQEAQDVYDLIEWAAQQPWSNGKVGMSGVSYLAWIQWKVAALNPPHLAAINPWEGVSDFYRELAFHGGIPTWFLPRWFEARGGRSFGWVEDLIEMRNRHPLLDEYWASKNPDLSKIRVPAFIVASWSDHGLHTRGTLEAFRRISSRDKWLLIHGRRKWQTFYEREFVEKRRLFFDRFLKGIDNEVKNWPRVMYEVRYRFYSGKWKTAEDWPIPGTKYVPLYLDAKSGRMSLEPVREEAEVSYDAVSGSAVFEYRFDRKTEVTGYMKLKLWVEARGHDDMDLFVAVKKIDPYGVFVRFPFATWGEDGPVALGWLRVSHRELDEERSTIYQPVYKHKRLLKLKPGEIVPVEIEIWPSSTMFYPGEKMQLIIAGSDIYKDPLGLYNHIPDNKGIHVIYTGGKYDSHLLIPIIPQ